ncbi:uncharacterized protein LOC143239484 [Tachypleus tridentatus]|uniref:uncharacterized protein LOC143239484 n=1 Tax=Tachypleus tridentatus TaxID=6853 RepID=UPI003FCF8979
MKHTLLLMLLLLALFECSTSSTTNQTNKTSQVSNTLLKHPLLDTLLLQKLRSWIKSVVPQNVRERISDLARQTNFRSVVRLVWAALSYSVPLALLVIVGNILYPIFRYNARRYGPPYGQAYVQYYNYKPSTTEAIENSDLENNWFRPQYGVNRIYTRRNSRDVEKQELTLIHPSVGAQIEDFLQTVETALELMEKY